MCRKTINCKELGHTLEVLRVAKRMTLEDVKNRTGLYTDQIREIENGKSATAEVINRMLALYDLELIGSYHLAQEDTPTLSDEETTEKGIGAFFKTMFGRNARKRSIEIEKENGIDGTAASIEYDFNTDVDRVIGEITQTEEKNETAETAADIGPVFPEMATSIADSVKAADAHILATFIPIVTTSVPVPGDSVEAEINKKKMQVLKELAQHEHVWEAWTDGGWLPNKNKGAWAYIILCDGIEVIRSSSFLSSDAGSSTNMEYCAILHAVGKALTLGIKNIVIHSDAKPVVEILNNTEPYSSSDSWLNETVNKIKKSKMESFKSLVFEWVESHSNDKWNKAVDNTATQEFERRKLQRR